ncbi:hypothetical protein K7432_016011 [Basidiobolus ranarum]|uniref:Uncharacterized protein n=1 Tax=Basidiobolus ranarum TaxID=34480 RepID=A0ABR2WFD9_9FUNG
MQELPRNFERQVWLERLASLLELDQLPYIERLTTLWRHSGVSRSTLTAQTQQIERPGLTYCRDPFQEPQLHQVFHHLDNIELSRKILLQYLSTGTVNIARDGLDYGDFEGFALVILYLQYFLFPSPSAELEDAVSKIQNQVWPVKCYKLKQSTWSSAFTEANLRVYNCKSSMDADGISQSNIYLNELLEFIRLRKLEEGALLSSSKLSNEDLQKLGKALASCFFAVIEFAGNSDWIVVQNLQVLSKNGARLPGSWYTSEFLSTTKNLAERFSTPQSAHSTRGLSYLFDLWAFWLLSLLN